MFCSASWAPEEYKSCTKGGGSPYHLPVKGCVKGSNRDGGRPGGKLKEKTCSLRRSRRGQGKKRRGGRKEKFLRLPRRACIWEKGSRGVAILGKRRKKVRA